MNTLTTCHHCSHENQVGWRFCSQCGKSRKLQTVARKFAVKLDFHPEADLGTVLGDILRFDSDLLAEWSPGIDRFRQLCERHLTENQQQCLIRRYKLHLPGRQDTASAAIIARERGGSGSAAMDAVKAALRNLSEPIRGDVMAGVSEQRDSHIRHTLGSLKQD